MSRNQLIFRGPKKKDKRAEGRARAEAPSIGGHAPESNVSLIHASGFPVSAFGRLFSVIFSNICIGSDEADGP
jgi:hypothetical protein